MRGSVTAHRSARKQPTSSTVPTQPKRRPPQPRNSPTKPLPPVQAIRPRNLPHLQSKPRLRPQMLRRLSPHHQQQHNAAPAPQHTTPSIPPDTSNSWPASAVKVPPAVMEKNLLVSRVPAYPDIAKASRVQGSVIVQALISKTGDVSRIRVVQGDTRLRNCGNRRHLPPALPPLPRQRSPRRCRHHHHHELHPASSRAFTPASAEASSRSPPETYAANARPQAGLVVAGRGCTAFG